jgi:hypothetical protein
MRPAPYRQLTLLGHVLAEEPFPFCTVQWENPIVRTVSRQDWVAPINFGALNAVQEKPFHQDDWPNPVLRILEREWGEQDPLDRDRFIIPETVPFNNYDQPNPILRISQREWGFTKDQVFNTVSATPFVPLHWPNPILRVLPRQDFYAPINYGGFVAIQTKPFHQDEWPNPIRRILQREWGWTEDQPFDELDTVPPVPPIPPVPPVPEPPTFVTYTGPPGRVTANRLAPYLHGSVWKKQRRDRI